MSVVDLLSGNYAPFLSFPNYKTIVPKIGHSSAFKCKCRSKGLAVSADGRVFRMRLSDHGYNDKFIMENNECVLSYVCGTMEEQRRQNLNRPGDPIIVELGDNQDRHAILHGVFKRIEATPDKKPDETELLTARSYLTILAYDRDENQTIYFEANDRPSPMPKKMRPCHHHLIIDTESAAPLDQRLLGRRHSPFPMLEVAYYRVSHDFSRVIKMRSAILAYDSELTNRIGNDEQSAVLKFSMEELRLGDPAHDVVEDLFKEIRCVGQSGGLVFAHNVVHDLGQIKATLDLIGRASPGLCVRTIDTVKTAGNFVEGAEKRWMKLGDLATLSGLSISGHINGRLHCAADDALLLLHLLRKTFASDQLDAFVETYTL